MKQSFVKTIQGHEIEFERLLYPIRYNVFVRNLNANPALLVVEKDGEGCWSLAKGNSFPVEKTEISAGVFHAISANEMEVSESVGAL
ncbi:MAG: hypothetical protein JWQ40_4149 [Segetibacter sp.]|nr:hypothetical protein [Segetibacter sp.]